ncbi:MAG: EVE domain-containing protein [Pseudomonadales bacterium]|jgi:hypothetical protein|nr:EVE domain-containing protein [Pseudomonadales bacterium]
MWFHVDILSYIDMLCQAEITDSTLSVGEANIAFAIHISEIFMRTDKAGSDTAMNKRNWIAVACADHAWRGREAGPPGFMQVCHGKRAPLARIGGGDRVVYYAPATVMRGSDRLQSFVSIGVVEHGEPYSFDMGDGFVPWRRDVHYVQAQEAPIRSLLTQLDFIEDPAHWGYKFRFGLFSIGHADMRRIALAMRADLAALGL